MSLEVLLTCPHGAPDNDRTAPDVARAIHEQLTKAGVTVRTLISTTDRYTVLDMNRPQARDSVFRRAVQAAVDLDRPSLHIDVHSYPLAVARFSHQDIVLLHGWEHPDRTKPLQDGEWLRRYARLLTETESITACVQTSEYPNDVCQHVISMGHPRDRCVLAEHCDAGNAEVFAAAHVRAIQTVLGRVSTA